MKGETRRLGRLEEQLTPLQATLRWLEEAQGFPSLQAYVGWLLDQPDSAWPLVGVPAQAVAGAARAHRGEPRTVVHEAERLAERAAVFLVVLVLECNTATRYALELEGLRFRGLRAELRALTCEEQLRLLRPKRRPRPTARPLVERYRDWGAEATSLFVALEALERARLRLEGRYLQGHESRFPDAVTSWQALREGVEMLVGLGDSVVDELAWEGRIAEGAIDLSLESLRAKGQQRAPTEARRIVDLARHTALDLYHERDAASAVLGRLLKSA